MDYDDTEFLQKMFSNADSDIRNLNKNGTNQNSQKLLPFISEQDSEIHESQNDAVATVNTPGYNSQAPTQEQQSPTIHKEKSPKREESTERVQLKTSIAGLPM